MKTIDDVKRNWREKMEQQRNERDWLSEHGFKIEAMVKGQIVDMLWNILFDLDRIEDNELEE